MHLKHLCLIYTCLSEVILSEVVRDKNVFKKHFKKLIWRCSTILLWLLTLVKNFSMLEEFCHLLFHFYFSAFSDPFWLGFPISKSLSGPSWYVPNAYSLFFMCAARILLEWDGNNPVLYLYMCIWVNVYLYLHVCVYIYTFIYVYVYKVQRRMKIYVAISIYLYLIKSQMLKSFRKC